MHVSIGQFYLVMLIYHLWISVNKASVNKDIYLYKALMFILVQLLSIENSYLD